METGFQVTEEGTVVTPEGKPYTSPTSVRRESNLGKILEMMGDPDAMVAEVSRMITIEITMVLRDMVNLGNDPTVQGNRKNLNEEIRMLRELQKSLSETEELNKRDYLNFDGPKFQFVFTELLRLYTKAMKQAGVDDGLSTIVMKELSDLVRTNDERLRRETAKVGNQGA